MFKDEFYSYISVRKEILERTCDEAHWEIEEIWNKETKHIIKNMDEAISFINNDATWDDIDWMSEIFDDIFEQAQDMNFVDALLNFYEKNKNLVEEKDAKIMYDLINRYKEYID